MALSKVIYTDGETIIHSDNLNSIQDEIIANAANIEIKVNKVDGYNLVSDSKISSYDSHIANTSNPHSVTKSQVGLGNVDNTSDTNKPISTAVQTALDLKRAIADSYTKTEVDTKISSLLSNLGSYSKYSVSTTWSISASSSSNSNTVTIPAGTYIVIGFTTFNGTSGKFTQAHMGGSGCLTGIWNCASNGGDSSKETWCLDFFSSTSAMSIYQTVWTDTAISQTATTYFHCLRLK